MDLLDPAAIANKVDEIAAATTKPGAVVYVCGSPGAGRSRVVDRLIERDPQRYLFAQAPSASDPDAPLHVLLQIAVQLDEADRSFVDTVLHGAPIRKSAQRLAQGLEERQRCLLLRLPTTWQGRPSSPDGDLFEQRASDLLRGLRDHATLSVVILAPVVSAGLRRDLPPSASVGLPAALVTQSGLQQADGWGKYRDAAARVASRAHPQTMTAFQLGLAIAIEALGEDSDSRPFAARRSDDVDDLVSRLVDILRRPHHAALGRALRRVALARFAVEAPAAVEIAGLPEEHAPLLTHCVAYESGGLLRMTEMIRNAMLELPMPPAERTDVHGKLGEHFASRDGVSDPRCTTANTMIPWLEATHHFAWAGALHIDRWRQRAEASESPEFYWDRARALSIQDKDYAAAAEVYRACAERFPDDHYAHHYRAWNLDRAGRSPADVEAGFREAIKGSRDNVWYHSRLVTFLIRSGRFADADEAWSAALAELDPDRARSSADETLVSGLHRWVVDEWITYGELERARRVFDTVADRLVTRLDALSKLAWRLADAEEARALGVSVYPAGYPVDERWTRPPHHVPRTRNGRPLQAWYPTRVIAVGDDVVELAAATPEADPDAREVIRTALAFDEWRDLTGGEEPADAEGYWILARYGDDSRLIRNHAPQAPWERRDRDAADPLRYFRQWAGA